MKYFIRYEDIGKDVVTIDCRTEEEFYRMPLFKYNIPIITKRTHQMIKKFYPCALFVIAYCLCRDHERIKGELLRYSKHGTRDVVIGCSRGRLRSPIMCIYARHLGINAVILRRGIKRIYEEQRQTQSSVSPQESVK